MARIAAWSEASLLVLALFWDCISHSLLYGKLKDSPTFDYSRDSKAQAIHVTHIQYLSHTPQQSLPQKQNLRATAIVASFCNKATTVIDRGECASL